VKIAALVEELSDISARQPGDAAQHALDGGAELLSLLLLSRRDRRSNLSIPQQARARYLCRSRRIAQRRVPARLVDREAVGLGDEVRPLAEHPNCHRRCHRTARRRMVSEGSAPAQRGYFGPEIKTVWNGADLDGWAFWGLLNRYTVISRIVGSNPIPSATLPPDRPEFRRTPCCGVLSIGKFSPQLRDKLGWAVANV
jgi:hypothetical protein